MKSSWFAGILISVFILVLYFRYPHLAWTADQKVLSHLPSDFLVYWKANQRFLLGENPYLLTESSPFKYAPPLFLFFQFLPSNPATAWWCFGTINLILFGLALFVGEKWKTKKSVFFLFLGFVLGWKGILEVLDYGQMEFFIFFLAVLVMNFFDRRPSLSGLLCGFLPCIKLPWILFAFPFLWVDFFYKKKKFLFSFLSSIFLWFFLFPFLFWGWSKTYFLTQSWLNVLNAQPSGLFLNDINQSLWVWIFRFWNSPWALMIELLMGLALYKMSFRKASFGFGQTETENSYFTDRLNASALSRVGSLLLWVQLMNPLAWRWGSVYSVAATFSMNSSIEGRFKKMGWLLLFVLFLLQQNPIVKLLGFSHWTDIHRFGVVTLYWIVLVVF